MHPHFTETWRAVATAKIGEFAYQCERLADLPHAGDVNVSEAATCLHDIAVAHSLYETFGQDCIVNTMAWAFAPPVVEEARAA
jgi:hypothetical protein